MYRLKQTRFTSSVFSPCFSLSGWRLFQILSKTKFDDTLYAKELSHYLVQSENFSSTQLCLKTRQRLIMGDSCIMESVFKNKVQKLPNRDINTQILVMFYNRKCMGNLPARIFRPQPVIKYSMISSRSMDMNIGRVVFRT